MLRRSGNRWDIGDSNYVYISISLKSFHPVHLVLNIHISNEKGKKKGKKHTSKHHYISDKDKNNHSTSKPVQ